MAHSKKSRKPGPLGTPKSSIVSGSGKRTQPPANKVKKRKGLAPGSRHSQSNDAISHTHKEKRDPRLGSKKKIELTPINKSAAVAKTIHKPIFKTPAQELQSIENDTKLQAILDNADKGNNVTQEQHAYMERQLARHAQLCDLMGINNNDEPESNQDNDPFADLDAIDINDFR